MRKILHSSINHQLMLELWVTDIISVIGDRLYTKVASKEWSKLHKEQHFNLYPVRNIVSVIKSRRT
jgi:hypothetical protein